MKRFKPGQLWETASGHVAQIICTNYGNPEYPILAIITHSTKWETAETFTWDGLYNLENPNSASNLAHKICDLMRPPRAWEVKQKWEWHERTEKALAEAVRAYMTLPEGHPLAPKLARAYEKAKQGARHTYIDWMSCHVLSLKRLKP